MNKKELNSKCFQDFVHYIKGCKQDCVNWAVDIHPLKSPMIHNSKKNGEMLLLAIYHGELTKNSSKDILSNLSNNVKYDKIKLS